MIKIPQFVRPLLDTNASRMTAMLTIAAVAISLLYGLGLAQDAPLLMLVIGVGAVLVIFFAFANPSSAAVILLGIAWGNLSDVVIKIHGLPSLNKPLVALLVIVLIVQRVFGRRTAFVHDRMTWWLMAYFAVTAIGLWYAPYADRVFGPTVDFAKDIIIYLVLINLLSSGRAMERGVWALVLVGALLSTVTVYQEITQTYTNNYGGLARVKIAQISADLAQRSRAAGPIGDPNYYGQQLLVLVPLGLWAALNARSLFSRSIAVYATIVTIAGIVLTFSRGTYLALFVVFILCVLRIGRDARYFLVVPLIAGLLLLAPPEFRARLGTLEDLFPNSDGTGLSASKDGSLKGRSVEMLMALNVFSDYPILGVGQNNYAAVYQRYIRELGSEVRDLERSAHNLYLQVAAEHGIIGLVVFFGILTLTWNRLRAAQRLFAAAGDRRLTELAVALQVGFAGYLVAAFFLHDAYPFFLWLQVSLAVALASVAAQHTPSQAQQPVADTDEHVAGGLPETA